MKYVCIDDGAVSELMSGREYQSIDFAQGDRLINVLSGIASAEVKFISVQKSMTYLQDKDGAFLTTKGNWKKKKFLVIDCEQSSLFTQLRSEESLSSFQKLLRFCSKYWSGGVYNNSEKIIVGTTKAVIFPLPYSTGGRFRIAIERKPLANRLSKRDLGESFLLVYKSGKEGADSTTEEAGETNFRRVFDRLSEVYSTVAKSIDNSLDEDQGSQMASTNLQSTPDSHRAVHMPFSHWIPQLTEKQRSFVFSDASKPHRLQGPAGTGKTLSLVLRVIGILSEAQKNDKTCRALIVAHSEATRDSIQNALSVIDPDNFQSRNSDTDSVTLTVETLASLCAKFLSQSISETEFVDRDAQDSKLLQHLYIEQSITEARKFDFQSFKPHLSEEFRSLFDRHSDGDLTQLFQHEISTLIKGRAGDSFDVYKNCPSLKYGLPISNEADKGFVFNVFRKYQAQLEASSQFDTDDVVISAVGQLDTPIWRRRRSREGFDFIGIDETHLFNINELHVFHHFTRSAGNLPISFTVDEAQAVGDRGWNDTSTFSNLFGGDEQKSENTTTVTAVFRCSPAIKDFCHSILASGATLFTNFENRLASAQSVFTAEDERKSQEVQYNEYADDHTMIEGAFRRADQLQSATQSSKPQVLITSLSDDIVQRLKDYAEFSNKPVTILERRGDYIRIESARKSGHLVLGHADFVGGLEFNVVVIVGVDKGRVPYEGETDDSNSRSFASYAAHNRLYVASSRARYALSLLGVRSRGKSDLLTGAILHNLINTS